VVAVALFAPTGNTVRHDIEPHTYTAEDVDVTHRDFKMCQGSESSMGALLARSKENPDSSDFTPRLRQIAVAHGVAGDAFLEGEVTSNRDLVMSSHD
jgi:hypothetical protein